MHARRLRSASSASAMTPETSRFPPAQEDGFTGPGPKEVVGWARKRRALARSSCLETIRGGRARSALEDRKADPAVGSAANSLRRLSNVKDLVEYLNICEDPSNPLTANEWAERERRTDGQFAESAPDTDYCPSSSHRTQLPAAGEAEGVVAPPRSSRYAQGLSQPLGLR